MKVLFAHVQTLIAPSTVLIQAGILVAIYEYARGDVGSASDSIKNCIKMAHSTGLHKAHSSFDLKGNQAGLDGDEDLNAYCGLAIYER